MPDEIRKNLISHAIFTLCQKKARTNGKNVIECCEPDYLESIAKWLFNIFTQMWILLKLIFTKEYERKKKSKLMVIVQQSRRAKFDYVEGLFSVTFLLLLVAHNM